MGNEDTPTEVQQTDAENPGQASGGEVQTEAGNDKGGVQDRINELTKKYRESERREQALTTQNQELMQTLTQTVSQMSQRQVQQTQEPAFEMDPEERKKFDYLLSPIQRQLAAVSAQLAVSGVQQEIQAVVRPGTPPEVLTEAIKMLAGWRRQGIPGTPLDAITYSMGNFAMKNGDEDANASAQRRDFNRGAASVQTGQGNGTGRRTATKSLSEAEVERLSPQAQADYFGSRIGDEEF